MKRRKVKGVKRDYGVALFGEASDGHPLGFFGGEDPELFCVIG